MNTGRSMMDVPAYSLKKLTFCYHTRSIAGKDRVLNELSCEMESGKILGVLGPNGSGKSTLLKLLAGIFPIQLGSIYLFQENLANLPQAHIARTVALVPQETQQNFPFTIAEMVLMGRFPHHSRFGGWHWEDSEDLRIAQTAMQDLDVVHLSERLITDVSGGERQRAIIARAIAQQPSVLLLDEPTAFLDLHHQLDIARILKRLNQEHELTVVMVSHDVNLASQYCDQLILLNHGQIVKGGVPEEVLQPDILETVYGCRVLVDQHPQSGMPRISLPV